MCASTIVPFASRLIIRSTSRVSGSVRAAVRRTETYRAARYFGFPQSDARRIAALV